MTRETPNELPSAAESTAKTTADRVLARDRRRIRTLAALAIVLWVLAGLLIPSVYLPLGAKLKRYAQRLEADNPGARDTIMHDNAKDDALAPIPPDQVPQVLAQVRHQNWLVSEIVFHEWLVGAMILLLALGAGLLASICTVALALTIRRTTLRQVNEGLAQIAEQLRRLQPPTA